MAELKLTAVGVGPAEVTAALRREAGGYLRRSAAVELLITHGHWLGREPFLACLGFCPAGEQGPAVAVVDWVAVGVLLDYAEDSKGLPDTDTQRCVLGIAASLAAGYRVDLRDVVFCDTRTVELITSAIRAAGGAR